MGDCVYCELLSYGSWVGFPLLLFDIGDWGFEIGDWRLEIGDLD